MGNGGLKRYRKWYEDIMFHRGVACSPPPPSRQTCKQRIHKHGKNETKTFNIDENYETTALGGTDGEKPDVFGTILYPTL